MYRKPLKYIVFFIKKISKMTRTISQFFLFRQGLI